MSYPVSSAFWTASSSWYGTVKSAQQKAADGGGPKPKLATKEALWRSRGDRYLRGRGDLVRWFKGGTGAASYMVRVDPKLSEDIARYIASLNPAIVAAMDAHLGRLAFDAWRDWPVATGLSKSLISLEYLINGEDRFVGQITNSAPYVFFIKGSPHRKLLERPAPVAALRIVADIRRGFDRVAA